MASGGFEARTPCACAAGARLSACAARWSPRPRPSSRRPHRPRTRPRSSRSPTRFRRSRPEHRQSEPVSRRRPSPRARAERARARPAGRVGLPPVDARDEEPVASLYRPAPDLSDALHRPRVRELARFPREESPLEAVGAGRRSCSRTSPITAMPRRSARRATWSCSTSRRCRCRWRPSRPASASSRSQPRADARRHDRRVEHARRFLAPLPRRQAGAAAEAPGIDPLQFPDQPRGT